jgi:PAS domain S-box-containing protein
VNDITDKKTIEIALQKSEEKYKNILNNFKDGYFEVNLSGDITFLNSSLCTILGYSAADLQGKNFREFCDKANDTIYEKFNQVYRKGKPLDGIHWILIRKDGSERFVEISISLIDDDKKVTGFRGVIRDITQHIQAEEQKEKLERQLRHAQKMEAIGTLAGGVAHDLNNILSGLVSYPELLLLKIPIDSPLRKSIQTIQKSGEKAAAIVQDLLTLARRGLPALSIVNLNDIIAEHLKSPEHENLFTYQPIVVVKFQPGDNLLNISASNVHISKILLNLITNAAEAMPEGGTIKISTENMYIDTPRVGYHDIKEGEYIKLQIKDGGTGISPEEKERIFEPFYTKKKMGRSGTGLGMAMVWGAVHDHNGYIEVHSTPSIGTTISVYFPAVRSESIPDKTGISLDLLKGDSESILVVDDVLEQRELAAQMLTQLGYQADAISSGEEAIDYIKNHKIDLLIIDMIMDPGMDGLDAYKEIIKIRPAQKAIIATGYSTSKRIKQLQSLGAGACLKKPYLIEDLARAVRAELNR